VSHCRATVGLRSFLWRRLGVSANAAGNWAQRAGIATRIRKARDGKCRAGLEGRGGLGLVLVDPVGTLALIGFEGVNGESGLLHGSGHEAPDGMSLPAHLVHNLRQRSAVLALEHRDYLGRLGYPRAARLPPS
jgi:hypothetical protein